MSLAHIALARSDLMEQRVEGASDHVRQARAAIDQVTAPIAEWRISQFAASVCEQEGRSEQAALHRRRAFDVLNQLAHSLDETDRLRHSLLDSAVDPVLDEAVNERGEMPLPPYIAGRRAPDEQDRPVPSELGIAVVAGEIPGVEPDGHDAGEGAVGAEARRAEAEGAAGDAFAQHGFARIVTLFDPVT